MDGECEEGHVGAPVWGLQLVVDGRAWRALFGGLPPAMDVVLDH